MQSSTISPAPDWLKSVPWQLLATATLPRAGSADHANATFKAFINDLERTMRSRVGAVWSRETQSRHGFRVGHHFHLALAAPKQLAPELIAHSWRELVSGPADCITIDEYNPAQAGIGYILKATSQDADWGTWNLQHFTGATVPSSSRAARRWSQQLAA